MCAVCATARRPRGGATSAPPPRAPRPAPTATPQPRPMTLSYAPQLSHTHSASLCSRGGLGAAVMHEPISHPFRLFASALAGIQ